MGDPGLLQWCSDWVGPGLLQSYMKKVTGRFGPIPVRTPGRFGPIPFRPGRFGPISGVGHFGPILVGRFGPLKLYSF